jgi:hypothetical protein
VIGLEVEFTGWAAWLSYHHGKNLWHGSAPFGRAAKEAYGTALAYWHEVVLPRHYKRDSKSKYKHKPRKKPYLRIKKRLALNLPVVGRRGERIRGREAVVIAGGEVDNMRSGQTSRMSRAAASIKVTPTIGTLYMRVPSYVTMRSRQDRPQMGKEITTLTDQEVSEVSKVAHRAFFKTLHEEGRRTRKRKFVVPARS